MMLLKEAIAEGVRRGGVLVVLSEVEGSVPRGAGSWMMVWDEDFEGSIGGGELEYWAMEEARSMSMGYREEEKILGPELGQCCGGWVKVSFQRVERGAKWWGEGDYLCLGGGDPVVVDAPLGGVCLSLEDRREDLVIFGAGHVGKMVLKKAEGLPWKVELVDDREDVEGVTYRYERDVVGYARERVGVGCHVLIMTHSHDKDYEILREVLRVSEGGYVGLIGSETKAARFRSRLKGEEGVKDFHSPVGWEGIRGKSWNAAEVSISVWAELLSRYGR